MKNYNKLWIYGKAPLNNIFRPDFGRQFLYTLSVQGISPTEVEHQS